MNNPPDKLTRLLNSALAVEAVTPIHPDDLRPYSDRTPEERARGEAWWRFINRPPGPMPKKNRQLDE